MASHSVSTNSSHVIDDFDPYFDTVPREKLPSPSSSRRRTIQTTSPAPKKPSLTFSSSRPDQALSRIAEQKEFQQVTLNVEPVSDFIRSYVEYADVIEAPPEMHEAVALSLVAATLNYNGVTIPNGSTCYPLDFWHVLLTPSGGGRNTTVRNLDKILKRAGMGFVLNTNAWGSTQAMYQDLAENPRGLRANGRPT